MCVGGVAPPTQEVGRAIVLSNVADIIPCVLMLSKLCSVSGNVCGLLVWSVILSLRMGILEEQDGVVLGVSWTLPSGQASSHLSTSNEHFQH